MAHTCALIPLVMKLVLLHSSHSLTQTARYYCSHAWACTSLEYDCYRGSCLPSQQTNQKLVLGSTVEPLAALPAANRKDPQLAPPPITEEDARYGILSLLERGLIPPGADLTLEPSPVKQRLAQIYSSDDRRQESQAIAGMNHCRADILTYCVL